jgi:hypothetical protein
VPQTSAVDLALITSADERLKDLERSLLTAAIHHDAHTRYLWHTVPGIGTLLRLGRLDDIHDLHRVPSVQDFASDARLVTCRQESAGNRDGTSGQTRETAPLQGAVSEAAVLCLRHHEPGPKLLARLGKQPDQGKALSLLAHQLGRAVYHRLKRTGAFAMDLFRHSSGSRVREPEASLDGIAMSRTCACPGSDVPASVNAQVCLGPVSLSPAPLIGHALGLRPRRGCSYQVTCAAPPPSPARTGAGQPLNQAVAEDGMRARNHV